MIKKRMTIATYFYDKHTACSKIEELIIIIHKSNNLTLTAFIIKLPFVTTP